MIAKGIEINRDDGNDDDGVDDSDEDNDEDLDANKHQPMPRHFVGEIHSFPNSFSS